MGINGLERYNLQLVHGAQADIARHAIGKAVGAQSQQVLGDRTDGNGRQKLDENGHDAGKINAARPKDEINGVAGENGHVQRRRHRKDGKNQHEDERRAIRRCKAKDALQGAVFALHAPFTSLSESWLRQISR